MNNHLETQPLISIGMPVYNAGVYLNPAIASIKNQTYINWELIIIDDGSSDGAIDQLRTLGELNDKRIQVISDGKNKGLAARLNECINLAKGNYFARMDQDDISLETRLAEQISFLQKNPNIDLVSCKAMKINMAGNEVGLLPFKEKHAEIISKPWSSFYMPHPTWMGKVEWFKKYKYKVPQSYYSEDLELLLRSYEMSKFASLPEVLFAYRVKATVNWKNQLKARKAVLKLQTSHFYQKQEFFNLVLSIMVFVLKVIIDSIKVLMDSINRLMAKS